MNLSRRKTGVLALAASMICAAAVPAQATDASEMAHLAETFAREAHAGARYPVVVHASIGEGRLQMPDCNQPVKTQLPVGARWGARTLVQLRCEGEARWSILVPIDIESEVPVLILRAAAARGSTPGTADLSMETRRVPGTSADYVNSPAELVRQHLRRALGGGSVLTASDLEPDLLIRRGQTVSVLAESAGMSLRTDAIAMADARAGDRLRLQNPGSLKVFEGRVDNEGKVRVSP